MRRVAAAVVLLAVIGVAYWGHSGYKKREMRGAVAALVAEASSRLRDALQPRAAGADELERLEGHFKALASIAQRLSQLEIRRDPPLGEAAQQYVDEAHALLRRQLALQRASDKLRADLNALTEHIGAARVRSSDWIREAVALKQLMDRDFFDYRLAEGGLQKGLQALPDASRELAPLLAATPLIEDGLLADAHKRLDQASVQFTERVEAARKLPVPR